MDYQGLTIQFNGDASGLLATLRQIDGVTTSTQRSLSQVTKALKLDPSSAALYASQSKLLRRSIGEEEAGLNRLRTAYGDYSAKLRQAEGDTSRYGREISRVTSLRDESVRSLEENEAALKSTRSSLEEYSRKYRESQSYYAHVSEERSRLFKAQSRYQNEENRLLDTQNELLDRRNGLERTAESISSRKTNPLLYGSQVDLAEEYDTVQQRIGQVNGMLDQNTEELGRNHIRINDNAKSLEQANQKYEEASRRLNENADNVRTLTEEDKRLTSESEKYTSETRRLNSSLKSLNEAQKENADNIKKYKDEIDKAGDQIEVYKAKIKALREEMTRLDVSEWLNSTKQGQFFRGLESGGKAVSNLGDQFLNLGTRISAVTAMAGGMFARQVISEAEEYGNAISQVGGYLELTGDELSQMSDLALYWGKETQFSATEAAQAMSELAKGGMTDAQIRGGALEATMQLAAAGGIDMATAATVAVNAIKVFDLSAEDATDVADALAGAANKSTAEVGSLASAFRYVSGWAGLADYSINDVSGALGLLADHGLQAEMAGTGLRNFMQRLGAPTGKAKEILEEYGVEVYDTSGKMKGLADLVDELNEAFGELDDETRNETLNTIFGARALPTAIALMGAGREELEEYIAATQREGYATEMMQARMGDLGWALEYLRGEFETTQVNIGSAFTPVIVEAAGAIEDMLSTFNSWDSGKQREFITQLLRIASIGPKLMLVGAAMKVVGGTMMGVSRFAMAIKAFSAGMSNAIGVGAALSQAFNVLSGGALAAEGALFGVAGGLLAIVAAVGAVSFAKFMIGQWQAQRRAEKLEAATTTLAESIGGIKTGPAAAALGDLGDAADDAKDSVDELIDSQKTLNDTIGHRMQNAQFDITELEQAKDIVEEYSTRLDELSETELGELLSALQLINDQTGLNLQYNSSTKQIYDDEGTAIEDLIVDINNLVEARENEIKRAAALESLKEKYKEENELLMERDRKQKEFNDTISETGRIRKEMREIERGGVMPEEMKRYDELIERENELHERSIELREELNEIDQMHESNLADQEFLHDQLAESMANEADNAEMLKARISNLSSGDDELAIKIRELREPFDDLVQSLIDAGVQSEVFSVMSREQFATLLEQSGGDIGVLLELLDQFAQEHAAEIEAKGAEQAQEEIESTKQAADDLDGTHTIEVKTNTDEAKDSFDAMYGEISSQPPIDIPVEPVIEADQDPITAIGNWFSGLIDSASGYVDTVTLHAEIDDADAMQNLDELYRSAVSVSDEDYVLDPVAETATAQANINQLGASARGLERTYTMDFVIKRHGSLPSAGMKDGGMLYRHADGYITNHSLYSGNHVIGEAGIEAVLPLNNRAATQPLVDAIADGVSSRIGGGNQYNLYINDARVNDDPAIRSAFIDLMGAVNRKGMQTNAAR